MNQEKLEQMINKDSLINKEEMTNLVELGISLAILVQTIETKALCYRICVV